jgi:hypothetical protein
VTLHLDEGVLRDTLTTLRSCGGDRHECVVYWAGPRDDPGLVDEVLHPRHRAAIGSYELESSWVTECWISLTHDRRMLKAQLHTHPGSAYHSATDDRYPIVHTPGFLSIVLPLFAAAGLAGVCAYELRPDGGWVELPIDRAFQEAT